MAVVGTLFLKYPRAAFSGTGKRGGKVLQLSMNTIYCEMLENSCPPADWGSLGILCSAPGPVTDRSESSTSLVDAHPHPLALCTMLFGAKSSLCMLSVLRHPCCTK